EAGSSTWWRADVVRTVARHTPPSIGDADSARAWVELTVDAVLTQPGVIRLTAPDARVPGELARRDGGSVFERHDAPRFTTLATQAGVRTETIAKFLHDHQQLQPGEVVIVDEAGMTATRQLAQLLAAVQAVEGKLVLVGDPAQLGPVEAGGLFKLLTDTNAIEL